MLIYANVQFFLALLLHWTSPRGVHKAGRTNMVSKHGTYRGENTTSQLLPFELRAHGPIHKLWYLEHS